MAIHLCVHTCVHVFAKKRLPFPAVDDQCQLAAQLSSVHVHGNENTHVVAASSTDL